jgi:F420-dependent oxidoreductase-like protein
MRFAVMIEGQEDVSWDDWLAVAEACERLGFEALFRSDHYMTLGGARDGAALDAWGTICGLAAVTSTLRLGTLVSPATFRHPSMLAKLVVTADHISGGRVELGLGTGWNEDEHAAYGFPFPPMKTRMDRLAEQLEIVHRTWTEPGFSFAGEHWTIQDLDARPAPVQKPHPPLVMGGGAGPRAVRLAARWADEYNVVHVSPGDAAASRGRLREGCERAGRDPDTLRFSLMHAFLIGADETDRRARAERLQAAGFPPAGDWPSGSPAEIAERLHEYAQAGVERVMLQHLLPRDTEALELIAAEVVPALS